jgi:hypothetical protein
MSENEEDSESIERQPLESHEFRLSLSLSIPHRLQGLSTSMGSFPIEIVWTARQIAWKTISLF